MSAEHWQSEDLMFRYHNDPRFHRFVQELISNAIYRSKRRDEWPSEQLAYFTQFDASHPKPEDIGGNETPDRIEANEDWYERNDFDRGDLRDEGRNPDGSGESYAGRNV